MLSQLCPFWNIPHKKSRKDMNTFQFFVQKQLLHHSSCQVAAGVTAAWRLEAARGVRHASCAVDAAPQTRCRRFVGTALLKSIAVVNNASRMQQLSLPCRWRVASCESRLRYTSCQHQQWNNSNLSPSTRGLLYCVLLQPVIFPLSYNKLKTASSIYQQA